jgi:hypothetical protein
MSVMVNLYTKQYVDQFDRLLKEHRQKERLGEFVDQEIGIRPWVPVSDWLEQEIGYED